MFAPAMASPGQPPEQKHDWPGVFYWLAVVHSLTVLIFLRTRHGNQTLGFRAFFSLLLLLFCMAGDPLMIWWVFAFIAALIVQRVITYRATKNGAAIHSLDAGVPVLTKLVTEKNAMALEAILCVVAGMLLMAVSQFMGVFMMLGFVSLVARGVIEETVFNHRLERMRDAQIEGRWYGDRMR